MYISLLSDVQQTEVSGMTVGIGLDQNISSHLEILAVSTVPSSSPNDALSYRSIYLTQKNTLKSVFQKDVLF